MPTELDQKLPVVVIGAGLSGLVAVKECLAAGLEVEAFDARDCIGGAWAYQPCSPNDHASRSGDHEPSVHSSMYDGTVINSCRDTTAFSDFPLDPAEYPDYFKHTLMLRYLQSYADHFDLNKHITLRTRVLSCKPRDDGTWLVRTQQDGHARVEEKVFGAVMACVGHETKPVVPDFPARDVYRGQFFHSHYYRSPGPFEGKKVAIIGFGSSAVDIACEIAPHAAELHLITRRGGFVLPRYVLGKPTEAWDNRATQLWVPSGISQWLQMQLLGLVDIKMPKVLKPAHRILEQNPTLRGDFSEKVATGLITIQRASVDAFTETGLVLSSGAAALEHVDVVICATGYDLGYLPFLPADTIREPDTPGRFVDLYKFIMSPRYQNLFLVGLASPLGPLLIVSEAQARHAAAMLAGRIAYPTAEQQRAQITAYKARQAKLFVDSERHALAMHVVEYVDDLLEPLGARPGFGRLLGRMFCSNPWRAWQVASAVWFGIPSSAQWRLCGQDAKPELARATMLRIAAEKGEMTAAEREALKKKL